MNVTTIEQGLVRVGEAADYLAVSRSKLYDLMDKGCLPYVKLGRSRRVPRVALQELVRQNLVGTPPSPKSGAEH